MKKIKYIPTKEEISEMAEKAYMIYATKYMENQPYGNWMPVWYDLTRDQHEAWFEVVKYFIKTIQ